jgi:iron complex outermembrane receptor protein
MRTPGGHARGFADNSANKLRDDRRPGASTPRFTLDFLGRAGHVLMEDIDRIETIRGPGGSLWGSNAINGS